MPQVIEQQGDVFGRIGKGLGQALSEQVPKEVERMRLSRGLKEFEETSKGQTPLQQVSGLLGIAGMTPEKLSAILPYVQAQQARGQAINVAKGAPGVSSSQTGVQPQAQASPSAQPQAQTSVESQTPTTTPEVRIATQQELRDRQAELLQNNPFMTPEQALNEATQENVRDIAQNESRRAMQDRALDEFNTLLKKNLQKDEKEIFSDISGELQNRFINRMNEDVLSGKLNTTEAANKYAKQALDFAKSRQTLKNSGSRLAWLRTTPGEVRKKIGSIRDQYEKLGILEQFTDDLVSIHGLSDAYASSLAFPVSGNKAINDEIASVKPSFSLKGATQSIPKVAETVAKNITPNDSIYSIALDLKNKGVDEKAFMEEIRRLKRENKISLNDRQQRELEKGDVISPTLGDIYTFIGTGKIRT